LAKNNGSTIASVLEPTNRQERYTQTITSCIIS